MPDPGDLKTQQELAKAIEDVNAALERQVDLWGKLKDGSKLLEKQKTDTLSLGSVLGQVGRVAGVAGGVITKSVSGGFANAEDAVGSFSAVVGLIPGPIGAAASAVTGLLGAAIAAMGRETRIVNEQFRGLFSTIVSGATRAGSSLTRAASASLEATLTSQQFQNAVALAGRSVGDQTMRAVDGITQEQFAVGQLRDQLGVAAARQVEVQRLTRAVMTSNLPVFQQLRDQLGQLAELRVQEQIANSIERMGDASQQAYRQFQLLNGVGVQGVRTFREAADMAERLALIQQVARARGITQQEAEQRLRNNGRLGQLEQEQTERRRRQFQMEALQRNESALERGARARRALEEAFPANLRQGQGAEAAANREQFGREAGRIFRDLAAAAGPMERLTQVFEEGTAAQVSAVRRAEAEQRGGDPQAQMVAIQTALLEQQRQATEFNRQAAQALQNIQLVGV